MAHGRVLAADIAAPGDVPAFHRSDVDGFAVRAAGLAGASEDRPLTLRLAAARLTAGVRPGPEHAVGPGEAVAVETGAVLPRGADAVVMVEHADTAPGDPTALRVARPATPGQNVSFAGADVTRGETVLWAGERLTSRETGVLAALGLASVPCVRRPRVAILSTGNELVSPGKPLAEAQVHDVNARLIADAVREHGGVPVELGIAPDDEAVLEHGLREAVATNDLVVLSGGTSKGRGDHTYRVLGRLGPPGILVHGVALKPGKPLCLAAIGAVPVVVLPGFPVSAIVTFLDFVAPVVRTLAGLPPHANAPRTVTARAATRWHSAKGRREYRLVHLVAGRGGALAAYGAGKGSGAITGFARADGFVSIDTLVEQVFEGDEVTVQLLVDADPEPAFTAIGSHCLGLDEVLRRLRRDGLRVRTINVGSLGGLEAALRGEADVAGVHLLDEASGVYNLPFVRRAAAPGLLVLLRGYGRRQGVVHRDSALAASGAGALEVTRALLARPGATIINRNRGSGTRILIDRLLAGAGITDPSALPGFGLEARSHAAVGASVAQGKADLGVAIERVATDHGLSFAFLADEQYDFVVPADRLETAGVLRFRATLCAPETIAALGALGFEVGGDTGRVVD